MINELIEQVLEGDHPKDVIESFIKTLRPGGRGRISKIPLETISDADKFTYEKDELNPGYFVVTYDGFDVGDQNNYFGDFDSEAKAKKQVADLNKLLDKRRKLKRK